MKRKKIGIMLRHYNQHGGGVWVYTRNLLPEMLALDVPHEFVLMYPDAKFIGTYGDGKRIREIAVEAPHPLLWDQVAVPRVAKRENLDLIFNPKYSIPLNVNCATAWVCHGLNWYVNPKWKPWSHGFSHRYLIPRYARKADGIIAVSEDTRKHLTRLFGIDERKVHAIHLGIAEQFLQPVSTEARQRVREEYGLPERFYLFVGQIYPTKNLGRLLQAYARVGPQNGIHLVVAGQRAYLCQDEIALIDKLGLSSWVVGPRWIDHKALPPFYSLAEALIMPSLHEACPSPPLEAMSLGCPVVTSDRYGTLEVSGDAALFVNPDDVSSIAEGMQRIIQDKPLRRHLIEAGKKRASQFSWKKCAQETMQVLDGILQNGNRSPVRELVETH